MPRNKVRKTASKFGAIRQASDSTGLSQTSSDISRTSHSTRDQTSSNRAGGVHSNGALKPGEDPAEPNAGTRPKGQGAAELAEKIKELVRLAQEQGYLTYGDINDALPDNLIAPEDLDEIYSKLRNLEVEIVDQAEVDRVRQPEPEEDDEKTRLDI